MKSMQRIGLARRIQESNRFNPRPLPVRERGEAIKPVRFILTGHRFDRMPVDMGLGAVVRILRPLRPIDDIGDDIDWDDIERPRTTLD